MSHQRHCIFYALREEMSCPFHRPCILKGAQKYCTVPRLPALRAGKQRHITFYLLRVPGSQGTSRRQQRVHGNQRSIRLGAQAVAYSVASEPAASASAAAAAPAAAPPVGPAAPAQRSRPSVRPSPARVSPAEPGRTPGRPAAGPPLSRRARPAARCGRLRPSVGATPPCTLRAPWAPAGAAGSHARRARRVPNPRLEHRTTMSPPALGRLAAAS